MCVFVSVSVPVRPCACVHVCALFVENAAAVIGETGGVQDILSALRAFPNSPVIATNCCTAVWSLCASGMRVCLSTSMLIACFLTNMGRMCRGEKIIHWEYDFVILSEEFSYYI